MSKSVSEEKSYRQIENIQQLIQQSLSLSRSIDCEKNPDEKEVKEMTSENREWLRNAIESYSLDMCDVLKPKWQYIKCEIYSDAEIDENLDENMENICELCENIDFANVFFCIGGLNDIIKLIAFTTHWKRCQLLAFCLNFLKICLYNNELCQKKAKNSIILDILFAKLTNFNIYENESKIFFKCLDTLSAYMSGSVDNFLQIFEHPLIIPFLENTISYILFDLKDIGFKNNIIRFYIQILHLETIQFMEFLHQRDFILKLVILINHLIRDDTFDDFNFYFKCLHSVISQYSFTLLLFF